MNQKTAKRIRKMIKSMGFSTTPPTIRYFKQVDQVTGETLSTLIPLPYEWPKGTVRREYQSMKRYTT